MKPEAKLATGEDPRGISEDSDLQENESFRGRRRNYRNFVSATTRSPARSSPEIPILCVLSESHLSGVRTKFVLEEVKSKWYRELTATDLRAVYSESKKNVVETVIKFSRKNLVEKGQLYPATEDSIGIWKPTVTGIARAQKEAGNWEPKYVEIQSMIEL